MRLVQNNNCFARDLFLIKIWPMKRTSIHTHREAVGYMLVSRAVSKTFQAHDQSTRVLVFLCYKLWSINRPGKTAVERKIHV